MKIAFIGGTRFIGHAAAKLAAAEGHEVTVLHRGKHPSEIAAVRPIAVDRNDPSALCETLARLAPDVVVDTRAMDKVDAEVTALAAKVLEVPVVLLSSVDVYAQFGRLNGLPAGEPEEVVTEGSALTIPFPFRRLGGHAGGDDYDKKEVESVLRQAASEGMPGLTVLRLPAVYGARDYRRRFGEVVDALDGEGGAGAGGVKRLPCSGGARLRITHAHVADVAHAILLAAKKITKGVEVFNVGEQETPTMGERAEAIARGMGATFEWEETESALPAAFALYGKMPNDVVVSSARIREVLGFREITREEERLRDTVAWLRESRGTGVAA